MVELVELVELGKTLRRLLTEKFFQIDLLNGYTQKQTETIEKVQQEENTFKPFQGQFGVKYS